MSGEKEPLSLEESLKSAIWWLGVLCDEFEVEPLETVVRVSATKGGEEVRELATQSLAEALENYQRSLEAFGSPNPPEQTGGE